MRRIGFLLLILLMHTPAALAQDRIIEPVGVIEVLSLVISLLVLIVGILVLIITLRGYMRLFHRMEQHDQQQRALQAVQDDLKQKFAIQLAALAETETAHSTAGSALTGMQDRLDELEMRLFEQQRAQSDAVVAAALLTLGEQQYQAHDLQGALNTYQRALGLSADHPTLHVRLAQVYTRQGDYDTAEQHLRQALTLDSEFSPALATLGAVYHQCARQSTNATDLLFKAEAHLFKALYSAPRLLDEDGESWWTTVAALYLDRAQPDKARDAYQKAAAVTPSAPYPRRQLALLTGQLADAEAMLGVFQEVERLAWRRVQVQPDDYRPQMELLLARLAAGKIQEAEDTLNTLLKTTPPPSALTDLMQAIQRMAELLPEQAPHLQRVLAYVQGDALVEAAGPARLPNEAFVLRFDGDYLPAMGLQAAPYDDPADIARRLELADPRPAIFVLGGAGNMAAADMERTHTLIEQGLVQVAEQQQIALVDGGTQSGVMQMLGEARWQQGATFPLIGVAPVNLVSYPGAANPEGCDLAPGHSHFVLTAAGEWGDETDMLVQLARALTGDGQCPALGLIINGGAIVRQEVYRLTISERMRVPLLVLAGSGRFADDLAQAYHTGQTDDADLRAIIEHGDLHFVQVNAGPDEFQARLAACLDGRKVGLPVTAD
jgi:tetratricopeptide (TPR) repeat protein